MTGDGDIVSTDHPLGAVCAAGHALTPGQRFCGECGQPAVSEAALPLRGSSETDKGRFKRKHIWTTVVGVGVIAILAIAVVLVISPHAAQSISYKDGDAWGKTNGAIYYGANTSTNSASPTDNCQGFPGDPSSGDASQDIPDGDNRSQWIAGCIAGYTYAESANNPANYNAQHPGANGG